MMKNSSWVLGLLTLVVFTGCDWCKKCHEGTEAPKTEQTAETAATEVPSVVTEITTKEQFEAEVLKADKLVVVDFYSETCGSCQQMKPVFEEVANTMKDKCKFVAIKATELLTEQGIQGVPTFVTYKDGQKQNEFVGAMSKDDFTKKIEEALDEHE